MATASVLVCEAVNAGAVIAAGASVVNVGDTFVVPIRIDTTDDLASWQFDLSFEPLLLQANSVTEGPFLSFGGTLLTLLGPGVVDKVTGVISLITDSFLDLGPYPSGTGVLAEIEFTALADGVSPRTLSKVFLNLVDAGFAVSNGALCVGRASLPGCPIDGSTPETATAALVAAALLCGFDARRRWEIRPTRA